MGQDLPKRRSSTDDARSTTWQALDGLAPEKRVVFDATLPEVLARVARTEVELDRVLVVTLSHAHTRYKLFFRETVDNNELQGDAAASQTLSPARHPSTKDSPTDLNTGLQGPARRILLRNRNVLLTEHVTSKWWAVVSEATFTVHHITDTGWHKPYLASLFPKKL